jgi:imidazolonepropionase-like amidohydrolase
MKRLRNIIFAIALTTFSHQVISQNIILSASQFLDVESGKMISPAVVVIQDGLIVDINPQNLPKNYQEVDLGNKILLPGLIDAHVHLHWDEDYPVLTMLTESTSEAAFRGSKNAKKNLMAGFTTIRTVGQDHPSIELLDVEIDKAIVKGLIDGPRIVPAGHTISISGGHYDLSMFDEFTYGVLEFDYKHGIANGKDECIKAVRYQIKHGAKVIKVTATAGVYSLEGSAGAPQFSMEELETIVEEADRHDVKVCAHAHGNEGILMAVKAGVASIEHGSVLTDDAIKLMIDKGTYLVPTAYMKETFHDLSHLPDPIRKKKEEMNLLGHQSHRKAIEAGVKIAFGTDVGAPKILAHGENAKEFNTMVKLGMTTLEAIRAATINAADLLGTNDRGAIEIGKVADIIAVDENPLADITVLENILFVMKGGQIYKSD